MKRLAIVLIGLAISLPAEAQRTKTLAPAAEDQSIRPPKLASHSPVWDKQNLAEARSYVLDCDLFSGDDHEYCVSQSAEFIDDYMSAKHGDRDDQGNVAYMLSEGGPKLGVKQNRLQGCAWRLAVIGFGGASISELDMMKMNNSCGPLSENDRTAAALRASVIVREVRAHGGR